MVIEMNIFKEMGLAVYSFKSYKEFLKNRKGKVFLFSIVVILIYFFIKMVIPFLMLNGSGLASVIKENVPDFRLENGVLWVEEEVQIDDGDTCVWIDTDPDEVFYDADEMEEYYDGYTNVWLMDSEKMLIKSNNNNMQQFYFADMDAEFSKEDLMALVPSFYFIMVIIMIICYVVMTALFFFGVLFVALLGMIVASCMRYQLTFGQLYLLGVYSRVLPLLIKALVSYLPFTIPYFWVINFGLSVVIIGIAIKGMREDLLQEQNNFGASGDTRWMQ
jgi:hypothetical protein